MRHSSELRKHFRGRSEWIPLGSRWCSAARSWIELHAGTQFDPEVVEAFLSSLEAFGDEQPDGRVLVVTEKATDKIDTFAVGRDGRPGRVKVHRSSGKTPFGFAFRRDGVMVVTEAFGGTPGKAAASSYSFTSAGLRPVTRSAPDSQSDVCWTVITNDGRYAYITNNGSGTISSYRIDGAGVLTLLEAVAGTTGSPGGFGTRDADLSDDGAYLYAIDVGTRTMNTFRVETDGKLSLLGVQTGLPATFAGLAAR